MELLIFITSLFFFLFIGVPIWLVLVLCSTILMLYGGMGLDVLIIPQAMLDGSDNYALMAIPFFIFALTIAFNVAIAENLFKLLYLFCSL